MYRRKRIVGVAIASLLSLTTLGEAQAADGPDALQQEINEVLATTQGGTQISRNEISWNDGQAILAFPLPGEGTAPASSPAAQKLQLQAAKQGISASSAKPATQAKAADSGISAATEEPAADDPDSGVSATGSDNCPTEVFGNDWYCFYQYKNYGGRRLQWNARHGMTYFSDYGFENKTSSWSNKGGMAITTFNRSKTGDNSSCDNGGLFLWNESAHSHSTFVGTANDNKADCFYTS
ncbi:peptidase inhibitor family I36 protein [Streptomyces sp. NPDC056708]|uniref:peptidase inhibitor family I36 protein n=1 Tax=unclassified Streptomyces TaxID=2593676 RepID=UPI0036A9B6F9